MSITVSRPFLLGSGLTIEEALASGMARAGSLSAGRDIGVVLSLASRGRATVLPIAGDVGSQFTPAAGWAQAIRYRVKGVGPGRAQRQHRGRYGWRWRGGNQWLLVLPDYGCYLEAAAALDN